MSARSKRALASLVLVIYMLAFIGLAAFVAPPLADKKWLLGIATFVAGVTWAVPLIPFLRWVSRGDQTPQA